MSHISGGGGGGSSGRTILTGNKNYFVTTTGNDSHNGSVGSPWLTLQHAMNIVSSTLDFAGFGVNVNIGAGAFVGFGAKACVGGGVLQFSGAGSSATTILNGPNDGVFNFGECITVNVVLGTILAVDGVLLRQTFDSAEASFACYTGGNNMALGPYAAFAGADVQFTFDVNVGGNCVEIAGPNYFFTTGGNFGIIGTGITLGGTAGAAIYLTEGAQFFDSGTWTLSGAANTVSTGFLLATFGGIYEAVGASYSGSSNGPRYDLENNSSAGMFGGTLGATFFPGTAAGTKDSSSSYDGVQSSSGVGSLANTDTYLDISAPTGAVVINLDPKIAFIVPNVGGDNFFDGESGNITLTGFNNLGTGFHALQNITSGSGNVGFGAQSLLYCSTGIRNIGLGYQSLAYCTTPSQNTAIGYAALSGPGGGVFLTGGNNTAVGANALNTVADGVENTAVGAAALQFCYHGINNTSIGFSAGNAIVNGNYNVIIGDRTNFTGDVSGCIVIGTGDGTTRIDYNQSHANKWTFPFPFVVPNYTVGTLPAGVTGAQAYVTDGDAGLAWGATAINSGGGATKYLVWYNAANWTVVGK